MTQKNVCTIESRKEYLKLKEQYKKNPTKPLLTEINKMKKNCGYPD